MLVVRVDRENKVFWSEIETSLCIDLGNEMGHPLQTEY